MTKRGRKSEAKEAAVLEKEAFLEALVEAPREL